MNEEKEDALLDYLAVLIHELEEIKINLYQISFSLKEIAEK